MAECGTKAQDISSDANFDFYCEFCSDHGLNVEADGYCAECKEYLCDPCCKSHKKTRQTINHEVLDKASMPKGRVLSPDRVKKAIVTTCKRHPTKQVEFYCKNDNTLGCSTCFITGHRGCPDIVSIEEKSVDILDSNEYSQAMELLASLDKRSRDVMDKAKNNIIKARKCHCEIVAAVKKLKEHVIQTLDKLEADIITEANRLVSDEEKQMELINDQCSSLTKEIKFLQTDFDSLRSSKQVCEIYIALIRHKHDVNSLQTSLSVIEKQMSTKTFRFEPNSSFLRAVALGNICIDVQNSELVRQPRRGKKMTGFYNQ